MSKIVKSNGNGSTPKNEAIAGAITWLANCFAGVCTILGVTNPEVTERTHLTVGNPAEWKDIGKETWPFHPAKLYGLYPAQFSRLWATKFGYTNVDGSLIAMNPSAPFKDHQDVRYAILSMVLTVAKLDSIVGKSINLESGKARLGVAPDKATKERLADIGFSFAESRLSCNPGSRADKAIEALAIAIGKPYVGEVIFAFGQKAKLPEDGSLPKTVKMACDGCTESLRMSLKQIRLHVDTDVVDQKSLIAANLTTEIRMAGDKVTVTMPCCFRDESTGQCCEGTMHPDFGDDVTPESERNLRDLLGRDVRTSRKISATKRSNARMPLAEKLGVSSPNSNLSTVTTTTKTEGVEFAGDMETNHNN